MFHGGGCGKLVLKVSKKFIYLVQYCHIHRGAGTRAVLTYLLSMYKALGLIPITAETTMVRSPHTTSAYQGCLLQHHTSGPLEPTSEPKALRKRKGNQVLFVTTDHEVFSQTLRQSLSTKLWVFWNFLCKPGWL